jgi:hypothetical protein
MSIDAFPTQLQGIIQSNYLERRFEQALRAKLAYRQVADREPFPARIGETLTKTRAGLLSVATTPLTPANNTNFDNGLTVSSSNNNNVGFPVEQYTLTINMYGNDIDLNVVTEKVGIANQFVQNAVILGEQAARTLDTLAANALFNTYMGGNTRTTAAVSDSTTVHVDDVRGFQSVFNAQGQQVAVSTSNTLSVSFGGTLYTVTGVVADGDAVAGAPYLLSFSGTSSNSSTAPGGFSGELTLSAAETISTVGTYVVAATAPTILRPMNSGSAYSTTLALAGGSSSNTNTLQMINMCMQAANTLRSNAVPDINGMYNCYIDPLQLQGLFNDSAFQLLFRGAYQSQEYRQGDIMEIGGMRFIPTNLAPQQSLSSVNIHRALVVGKGALVEGDFAGQDAEDTDNPLAEISDVDGVRMVTRAPMDRLQQIVSQAWCWIGGYVTPSDTTTNPNTIPTATNAAFKRAVILESQ